MKLSPRFSVRVRRRRPGLADDGLVRRRSGGGFIAHTWDSASFSLSCSVSSPQRILRWMGSAMAVVEISSDDEDGWRAPGSGKSNSTVGGWKTPGAGKHPPPPDGGWRIPGVSKDKSSDDGLEWAEKLLDEDCDAIGEGLHDSAEMQEFWASLMDETDIVVDAKKSLVGEPEKKSLRDADDDDEDCVILDGDPKKAVAVAKEEKPRRDATEDELEIVAEKGEVACRDFPHPRHLCAKLSFSTSSHASHCSMCHCYVCDSPAPCALWGKGTGINDHCHATDKDPKWKKLRQLSKNKSQQTPKLSGVQNLLQSSSTTSANLMIPSTGRLPISTTASQIQQMHPSIMVSQNMGQGIVRPRAPSPMPRTTIPSNRSKRARVAPPVHAPSNVNYMQPSFPRYSPMQPAFPRGFQTASVSPEFQTAQIPPGFQTAQLPPRSSSPPLSAAKGSQGYQRQGILYPQMPANTVVGTGVPLSRCTSLSSQGKQQPQGPSADATRTLRDVLTYLAHELEVPDYNINPPVGQQSASAPQTVYPNQLFAQEKARQGRKINPNNVAGHAPLRIGLSGRHNSSNRASGSTVISSDAVQARQPLCQLNSQSSLVPNETSPSTVVRSLPWNADGA